MPVKLVVTKSDDPDNPDEYLFEQVPVTIGRAGSSDLTLPDFKRVVSKEHAQISQQGGQYFLADMGSKNFTYLHGNRIEAGQLQPIQDGDTFIIGDFELQFFGIDAVTPDYDRTVFDMSFINPFEGDVEALAEALGRIRMTFEQQAAGRAEEALREALSSGLAPTREHHVDTLIANMLSATTGSTQMSDDPKSPPWGAQPVGMPPASTPPSPWGTPSSQDETGIGGGWGALPPLHSPPQEPAPLIGQPPAQMGTPAGAFTGSASAGRKDRLIATVMDTIARIIRVPWQFRHEFIGQTIMQAADTMFLYHSDGDELKQHLLDPSLSEEEFSNKLLLLREALEDVGVHQIALLDGYKAGVQHGGQKMLDALDPLTVAEELEAGEGNVFSRILPGQVKAKVLERLEEKAEEFRSSDWAAAEGRIYRPAFIKAYLARMTSVRK